MINSKNFYIGDREIGPNQPSFIIAEVAQAHDGSLGMAHSFIDIAADYGADAIKFQTHIANHESTLDDEFRIKFSYEDKTRFEYWKRMEFTYEEWIGLYKHAEEKKIIFLSSAFSLEAIDLLEKLNVPAWKVASGEINNFPFLKKLSNTKKPILISTGMSSLSEIDEAFEFLKSNEVNDIAIFQCTSEYPTSLNKVGINLIEKFRNKYNVPVGLSDHSGDIAPSIYAISKGASLIELHIALHPYQFGPDTNSSITPDELKNLSILRDKFHIMKSNPSDKDQAANRLNKMTALFGKSLCLIRNMKKGTILTEEMFTLKKPGNGIKEKDLPNILGKKLSRDVQSNKLITIEDIEID